MITASLAAIAMSTAADIPPDFAERAQAILDQSYDADAPGAVAIVVDDGKVVFEAGRGLADIEKGTPITPDTVFRYASITKQFTAATILQLVAEGDVELDAAVSRYLPEYGGEAGKATIRQLLNHTSGIMSYTNIPNFREPENMASPKTTAEMMALIAAQEMPAAHGDRMAYNNSAYVLLGAVIERLSGTNWDVAIRERIAAPLGLASLTSGVYEGGIAAMATGYGKEDDQYVAAETIHMSLPHAAGALVGTAGDLATWAQALHSGRVVSAPLYAQMIAPTTLADGDTSPFGFGLSNSEVRGTATIGHSGGIPGFSTDSLYMPDEDVFVAVLANSNSPKTDPSFVMKSLAALAIGNPYPVYEEQPLDLDGLESFLGRYDWDGRTRDLFVEDGKLFTQRDGSQKLEVKYAGDGIYYYGPDSATFFTLADADGEKTLVFHPEGAEKGEPGTRIGDVPEGPEFVDVSTLDVAPLLGVYEWPIGKFTVAQDVEGNVTGLLAGQSTEILQPASLTEWHVPHLGAVLTFTMEDGEAVSLHLKQGPAEMDGPKVD